MPLKMFSASPSSLEYLHETKHHKKEVRTAQFSHHPDHDTLLLSVSNDKATIWDIRHNNIDTIAAKDQKDLQIGVFSPAGNIIATCTRDEISLWEIRNY